MIYRQFRVIVIIRILLLVASIFLLVYLTSLDRHGLSAIILTLLIIFQIWLLIVYVERTNEKLSQLFDSIKHSDFSTSFTDKGLGKSFKKLNHSFNEVIKEFKKHRAEKEENFNYLQTVVQHINVGIICFNKEGKVDMYNTAAKHLFRKTNMRTVVELSNIRKELPEILLNMKAGDKTLIKIFTGDELKQLSIYATEFRMRGEEYILVAFQDIHAELEEKEIESWQKLIRVLTHEIMNSITPISSLASTVNDMLINKSLSEYELNKLDNDEIESVDQALSTIQKRSQGLLNFVDIYRNLTRIPKPNFKYFPIKEAFERAEQLLKPKIENLDIHCKCNVYPNDLKLTADPDLIDQVIINLLLNSLDAVKKVKNPAISLIAFSNQNNRITIEISDNGTGIKPDIIDKIFMPFFTSKKGGSGIGLSLSRQIMHLHKGSISVKSNSEGGTVFTLVF